MDMNMKLNEEIKLEVEKVFPGDDPRGAGFIKGSRWVYTLILEELEKWLCNNVDVVSVHLGNGFTKEMNGNELFKYISSEFPPVYNTSNLDIH